MLYISKIPIILHELGHAIGLWHEQSRADRDDYVHVHKEKIRKENWHNFNKLLNGTYLHYNKPYDFYSIMHYGPRSFAIKDDDITIEPISPAYRDVIGEARTLSLYDVQIVNAMYKCAENCNTQTCPGFRDKNCDCVCPGTPNATWIKCEDTGKNQTHARRSFKMLTL
ncbi:hypothetical protein DPMN_150161 [Dreissena polymorpha]|uniref:Metalloendopeptidase n=1 Tax=Dreissena polymorpha TaxID=45954 RepID=A0A9D4FIT0_DREPO|nr:hypothetical protein DPMN_150161 [Dreissena polymorpha]